METVSEDLRSHSNMTPTTQEDDGPGGSIPRVHGVKAVPPNKHMQRAGRHKVHGRWQLIVVTWSSPRARVLTGQRAGADVNR